MSEINDEHVIEQFRSNAGSVDGFEGWPLFLLTTTGRKSGQQRVTPLVYTKDGDAIVIAASKAGADSHPAWYLNIEAEPHVHVEVAGDAYDAVARIADRAERDRLYAAHAELMPNFAEYETKTTRVIPIVVLERA
jgi:deazaflavin-dependent oxidoreductase (nitroreductase family)